MVLNIVLLQFTGIICKIERQLFFKNCVDYELMVMIPNYRPIIYFAIRFFSVRHIMAIFTFD